MPKVDGWTILDRIAGCRLCRVPAGTDGLCAGCRAELPWLEGGCPRCALPLPAGHDGPCGECLADPPAFDRALIPFRYRPPLDHLVAGLKFHDRLAEARLLGTWLGEHARRRGTRAERLLPLPLHPQRLRERGFNQAAELCRAAARRAGLPWSQGGLRRVKPGTPQREARRRERLRRMRGAFVWQGDRPPPARVALVDDVLTTGATARAAAVALKQAGAEWVEIWAVARTPRPGES